MSNAYSWTRLEGESKALFDALEAAFRMPILTVSSGMPYSRSVYTDAQKYPEEGRYKAYFLDWCKTLYGSSDRFIEEIAKVPRGGSYRASQTSRSNIVGAIRWVWFYGKGESPWGLDYPVNAKLLRSRRNLVKLMGGRMPLLKRLAQRLDRKLVDAPLDVDGRREFVYRLHHDAFEVDMWSTRRWRVGEDLEGREFIVNLFHGMVKPYPFVGGRDEGVATMFALMTRWLIPGQWGPNGLEVAQAMAEAGAVVPGWVPFGGDAPRVITWMDQSLAVDQSLSVPELINILDDEGLGDAARWVEEQQRKDRARIADIRTKFQSEHDGFRPKSRDLTLMARRDLRQRARASLGLDEPDPTPVLPTPEV